MTVDELVTLTRERLEVHERRVVPKGSLVQAAVLVPIIDRGQACLAFAKRTQLVSQHKGQIAFPGGVVSKRDGSFLEAALRECEEEVGLARELVEPLGTLDDIETVATQFVITPFVGVVRGPIAFRPDGQEIERVIEVPFEEISNPACFRVEHVERNGVIRPVHFFECQGETIWGATARIVKHYMELLTGREWEG